MSPARRAAGPGVRGRRGTGRRPLWGVGCGWAFQSADWLVEETADALTTGGDLDAALDRSAACTAAACSPTTCRSSDIASGRPVNAFERRMYRAAARDRVVRRAFEQIGSRRRSPALMFDPRLLAAWFAEPVRVENVRVAGSKVPRLITIRSATSARRRAGRSTGPASPTARSATCNSSIGCTRAPRRRRNHGAVLVTADGVFTESRDIVAWADRRLDPADRLIPEEADAEPTWSGW